MDDVRLHSLRALRGAAEQVRAGCPKAVIGGGYKAAKAPNGAYVRSTTEALDSAYVRSTMDDVRLQSLRALRGMRSGGGENAAYVRWTTEALGGAYVRCWMYDVRFGL